MNSRKKDWREAVERNSGLIAVVVLSALLAPQIIARALPTGTQMAQMYAAFAVGIVGLALVYVVSWVIMALTPRRTSSQLTSVYLGEGVSVLVVSARFVAYALLTVLGAGMMVNVVDAVVSLGDLRTIVLIATILVLAIPVLIGWEVPSRLIITGAVIGALALGAVLGWALVTEAMGGIDLAASRIARLDAMSATTVEGSRSIPFVQSALGALFPAAVLALMSERVLARPDMRRVSPRLTGRLFLLLLLAIVVTLYFVVMLKMPGHRLTVVTVSMARAFWGVHGQLVVGVCYSFAGICAVLAAYSRLPRLIRELAMDRFLPDRLADAGSSGPRVAIVAVVSLLASVLASILTTTQAGAMVFIFVVVVISIITCLAMAARSSSVLRESSDRTDRMRARRTKWGFRAMVVLELAVLGVIGYANVLWALSGTLALLVPVALLMFLRRGRVKVTESLAVDDLTAGRKLPTRVHGVVVVSGSLNAAVLRAVSYARAQRLSSLTAITIDYDPKATKRLRADWKAAALPVSLTVLGAPRVASVSQVVTYVRDLRSLHPADVVVVFIPRVISTTFVQRFFIRHSSPKVVMELRMEPGVILAEVPYVIAENDSDSEDKRSLS